MRPRSTAAQRYKWRYAPTAAAVHMAISLNDRGTSAGPGFQLLRRFGRTQRLRAIGEVAADCCPSVSDLPHDPTAMGHG
jgi:hypothetical protein